MRKFLGKDLILWFKKQNKYRRILFEENGKYRIINLDEINIFYYYSINEKDNISIIAHKLETKNIVGASLHTINHLFSSTDCYKCDFLGLCENFKKTSTDEHWDNLCSVINNIYNFYNKKK